MAKEDYFDDPNDERVLFEWQAAERHFQRRDRDFWITVISILVLVSVILIFVKEFFLIVALVSVLFLYYVLSTVPPGAVKNKVTNKGVYFGESHHKWEDLDKFWFKTNQSSLLIYFSTHLKFPRVIPIVINTEDQDILKTIISKKLPFIEESPNFVDKLSRWFASKLPLENREKQN